MKKFLLSVAALSLTAVAFCAPVEQKRDSAVYTIGDGSLYGFENVWIQARTFDNFPTEGSYETGANSRGMTVVSTGGDVNTAKVLITRRTPEAKIIPATETTPIIKKGSKLEILVFNGLTGEQEPTIELPDTMFCNLDGDTLRQVGLGLNDIHVDDAGNVIVSNLITAYGNGQIGGKMLVYACTLDFTTSTVASAKRVIDYGEVLPDGELRIDYIGVSGDLTTNGFVLAANATKNFIFRYDIFNGENPEYTTSITLQEFVPASATSFASASRLFPIDENNFYADGFNTLPTLYDMDGNYVDGFKDPVGDDLRAYVSGISTGNNGVCEFNLSGKTFMVHAYHNNVATATAAPATFGIVKLDLEGGGEPEPMVIFPEIGMGTQSNAERTALPRIIVDESTNTAHIWGYQGNNGLAYYKFTAVPTGTKNTIAESAVKVYNVRNGKITLTEEVASVEVYSILGQRVAGANNVKAIEVPSANGIYVVKAIDMKGAAMTEKVILK
ncbi:MAG: T9SS type A sorting domain-containing protein [Paludibacteraceae bacterium]